jgi:ribose transport system substrate-binding protein
MKRRLIALANAAIASVFTAGAAFAEGPTIAVFTKNFTNPAYAAARRGADLVAKENGAKTIHYVPEKPDNVEQQKALVDQALAAHPNLVLFVPVDDKAMVEDVRKFTAAGIPVVSYLNKMEGTFVTHVGSDDVAVGYNGAKALFDELGRKGKVLAIEGNPAAPTSRDRVVGLRKALKEYPDVELLDVVTGMYQEPAAYEVTAKALTRHPQIDGVWAANDSMAYGALDALNKAGRKAKLVGANGLDKAIQLIEDGAMLASVEFSSFKIACTAARAGLRHLNGAPVPPEIMVPSALITRSNLGPWKVPLDQRNCPAWDEIVR